MYHPYHSFVFDDHNKIPIIPEQHKSKKYDRYQPFDGVIKLYKNDIKTIRCKGGKKLRVVHPQLQNTSGFLVFLIHTIPDSQDTKTILSIYVLLNNFNDNYKQLSQKSSYSIIMQLRPNGELVLV